MKNISIIFVTFIMAFLSTVAFSQVKLGNQDALKRAKVPARLVSGIGYLTCHDERKLDNEDCKLRFIKESDLEIFEIVDSPAVTAAHNSIHNNLKVNLKGTVVVGSVLHEDHLKVSKVEILEPIQDLPKLVKSKKAARLKKSTNTGEGVGVRIRK